MAQRTRSDSAFYWPEAGPRLPTAASGPLAGLRVLDLTTTMAGAVTTMLLGDHGAAVALVVRALNSPTSSSGPELRRCSQYS